MKRMRFQKGQSLIEVLLAVAIFAFLMTTVVVSFIDVYEGNFWASNRTDGYRMAQEGLEAVRAIRDRDFAELSAGTYGLAISGSQWIFSGVNDSQGIFTRAIDVSEPDANTRYVTSTVQWVDGGQTRSIVLSTVITNWQMSSGGPGPGTKYDWTSVSVGSTMNLPGTADALSAAASGTIGFIGRASSGDDEFVIIDASSSTNPSILGSVGLSGDANGIAVTGTYAFVAGTGNSQEVAVIDISNTASPSVAASINLSGNADANRVAIQGNRLYIVRDDPGGSGSQFYVYDISNPASPSSLGSVDLGDNLRDVALSEVDPFAFIGSEDTFPEFLTVNVTNPGSMGLGGSLNISGSSISLAVAVSGTVAYLGMANRGGSDELAVINVSSPTTPTLVNSTDYQDVNVLRATNGYLFAGLSDATQEFTVINLANPNFIIEAATLDLSDPVLDLGISPSRIFAVTAGNSSEVVIIEPAAI